MRQKIRKKIEAARGRATYWSINDEITKRLDKATRKILDAPDNNENLAETMLRTIDPNQIDREKFAEQMRITGCKTKREYVKYMMRLHNEGKRQ